MHRINQPTNQTSLTVSINQTWRFQPLDWRFQLIKLDGFTQSSFAISTNQDWWFQPLKIDGFNHPRLMVSTRLSGSNKIDGFKQSSSAVLTFNQSSLTYQPFNLDRCNQSRLTGPTTQDWRFHPNKLDGFSQSSLTGSVKVGGFNQSSLMVQQFNLGDLRTD